MIDALTAGAAAMLIDDQLAEKVDLVGGEAKREGGCDDARWEGRGGGVELSGPRPETSNFIALVFLCILCMCCSMDGFGGVCLSDQLRTGQILRLSVGI